MSVELEFMEYFRRRVNEAFPDRALDDISVNLYLGNHGLKYTCRGKNLETGKWYYFLFDNPKKSLRGSDIAGAIELMRQMEEEYISEDKRVKTKKQKKWQDRFISNGVEVKERSLYTDFSILGDIFRDFGGFVKYARMIAQFRKDFVCSQGKARKYLEYWIKLGVIEHVGTPKAPDSGYRLGKLPPDGTKLPEE